MPDFSIGVDLGGTNLRIAAITTEGQLLEKITLGVKVALGREHLLADGLGEEERTALIHGEVQVIALGGDVERVAS